MAFDLRATQAAVAPKQIRITLYNVFPKRVPCDLTCQSYLDSHLLAYSNL